MIDRTAQIGQEPFIFFFDPPDWRWLAFAEIGRRVRFWQRSVADLAPPARIGLLSSPSVDALLMDLAVRSLGLVSVPTLRDVAADLVDRGEIERLLDPRWAEPAGVVDDPGIPGEDEYPVVERTGGCLVESPDGLVPLATAVRGSAMRALDQMFARRSIREIVVHGRSLADPGERLVIDWAVGAAAAIVVAPSPEALASTIYWSRPTLLHGRADQLARLVRPLRDAEPRRRGLIGRFKRLRHVVVCGDEQLDEASRGFFETLGAEVGPLAPGRL